MHATTPPTSAPTNPSPALSALLATSIFAFLRRRRRNSPVHAPNFWSFLNPPTTPPPPNEKSPSNDNGNDHAPLFNPNPMITKPKPTATTTRLSKWLNSTLHHHHTPVPSLPSSPLPLGQGEDEPRLSPTPSLLSLPTTIHTRHTNSTFYPTTALHYPKGSGSGSALHYPRGLPGLESLQHPHPLLQHPLPPLTPSTTTTSSQVPDGSRDTMQVLLSEPPPPGRERNGGGGEGGGFLRPISVMELRLSGLGV